MLLKDALRVHLDAVQPYATTFQQAVGMIDRKYNSSVRQNCVKNYLKSLRVKDFEENGMNVSFRLSKLYKLISKLSRQVFPSRHKDAHRIEFLRKAVLSYQWSHEPLSRVVTHNFSFRQLYSELEALLQLNKEVQMEISRTSLRQPGSDSAVANIEYFGQGRYKNKAVTGVGATGSNSNNSLAI